MVRFEVKSFHQRFLKSHPKGFCISPSLSLSLEKAKKMLSDSTKHQRSSLNDSVLHIDLSRLGMKGGGFGKTLGLNNLQPLLVGGFNPFEKY